MSSIITNLSVIQKLANDLIKPRHLNYSEDCIPFYVNEETFTIENIPNIKNNYENLLKCTLIKHKPIQSLRTKINATQNLPQNPWKYNSKCIIFLHGLGSSRLEAFPLVESLPKEYCLFAFDFSGSGKSQGDNITYGVRQSEDIESVVRFLYERKGIKQFIIWGRSMGAVACLLYALNLQKNSQTNSSKQYQINAIVLDSPFSNFEEITKHIATKKVSVPHFLIDVAIHFIKQNFHTMLYNQKAEKSFNPFQIKFDEEISIDIPTVFLYSLTDDVVPKQHSEKIIKNFKSQFQKIIMEDFPHNQNRPQQILERIHETLKKFQKKQTLHRKRNSNIKLVRHGSIDFTSEISQIKRSRGISVCTPSRQRGVHNKSPEGNKNFYSLYGTMKVEPYSKKQSLPRSPRILSKNKKKEKSREKNLKIDFMHQLNTISYDPNQILKKKLLNQKVSEGKQIFKRRNSQMYNLQKRGEIQILNHTRYL